MSGIAPAARGPLHRVLLLLLLLILAGGLLQPGTTPGGKCAPGACAPDGCGNSGPGECDDGRGEAHHDAPGDHDCPGICCVGLVARPEATFSMPAPNPGHTLLAESSAMPVSISTEPSVRPPNRLA